MLKSVYFMLMYHFLFLFLCSQSSPYLHDHRVSYFVSYDSAVDRILPFFPN